MKKVLVGENDPFLGRKLESCVYIFICAILLNVLNMKKKFHAVKKYQSRLGWSEELKGLEIGPMKRNDG